MQSTGSTKRPYPSSIGQDDEVKRPCMGSFEGLSQPMELDMGIEDSLEYDQASNSVVQYETHPLRQGHPALTRSEADEAELETAVETTADEHMKVCNNYDTCFGVKIVATPNSCYTEGGSTRDVSVRLKPLGGSILLHDENCDAHLGSLSNSELASTLFRLPLRLDATLSISEIKDVKEKRKPQMKKHDTQKATQRSIIRIMLHGLHSDKEFIGNVLSDAGIFLQHPYVAEAIPGTRYDNPHYLARPGVGMPKLVHFYPRNINDNRDIELVDETRKGRFMRIFESAEADGGSVNIRNLDVSPRLRSPLMRHQVLALAMMQEKECGLFEEPIFPHLWRKEIAPNSKLVYYRHTITKSLEPKPILALGGILADDMGLGKTLSMLALICSSLDYDSATEHIR